MKPTSCIRPMLPLAAAFVLLGVASANADYPATILADHPSGYWRLEEAQGATTAVDSSTNGIGGTYQYDLDTNNVPDFPLLGQNGISSNSILFHVYTDNNAAVHTSVVDIPQNPILNPQGPFSIEFWARATSDNLGDYETPVGNFGGYGDDSGWHFYQSPGSPGVSSGAWIWNVRSCGAFIQTSPVVKNQWTHLVGVYDGVNLIFYINGAATATVSGAGFLANHNNDFFIGGDPATGHAFWEGNVDEVALYTNALSAGQIQTHYTNGLTQFSSRSAPPVILTDITSVTNTSGSVTAFDPVVNGATPFTYRWFTNGVISPAQTNSVLRFTDSIADNNSTYYLIVSNSFGAATSSVATLTVQGALFINLAPISISRSVGSYAAFHITASGAGPIQYQWSNSINGGATFTAIAGATNPTLWLTNIQLSMSGYEYAAKVNNPFVVTNPPAATLTVTNRAVTVPLTGYGAVVAADKPVAFWRLDESNGVLTATDAVGSFDGTYTTNTGSVTYGVTPVGAPHSPDPGVALVGGSTIQIPFAPELNSDTAWSAEMWLNPASLGANGGDYRVVFSSQYNSFPNAYSGWYIYQQPNNTFAFVPQPGNGFITAGPDDPANGNLLVTNKWYHLVVTVDTPGYFVYINGEARSSAPLSAVQFIPNGDAINNDGTGGVTPGLGNTVIGQRTDAAFGTFLGSVDDTAIYNYALTPQQVQAHFLSSTRLTITAIPGNKVVVTWPAGTLQSSANVASGYADVLGATSPFTNTVSGSQFYRVRVQ